LAGNEGKYHVIDPEEGMGSLSSERQLLAVLLKWSYLCF
jgi:hypothetical protein